MLMNRSTGLNSLVICSLLALVTLSFWSWLFIWDSSLLSDPTAVKKYSLYNEFLLVGILFGLDSKRFSKGPYSELVDALRRSARQAGMGLFAVFIVLVSLQDIFISRVFIFSYVPWLYLTLVFSNYIVPKWLTGWAFSGSRKERVALVGRPEQADQIRPWLERKSELGLHTIGVVLTRPEMKNKANGQEPPFPILGNLDELHEIFEQESITQLIVMDFSMGAERLCELTQLCESRAVRLLALDDHDTYFKHTVMVFEDEGVRLIGLREEPLESPVNRFVKRALDLAIALPVVLLLLPFTTALVWLCHRLQSPGPLFFKQVRNGLLGRTFLIYKYRTMSALNDDEAKQATANDRRIYPAGAWLRKFSIDELPQFINVMRGDMSVVGPRPHMLKHDELFITAMKNYVVRRFVRPGITGWAQVSGFRGEIQSDKDVMNRVGADIYYLENWSLSLDCVIILKTIKQCILPPRSAY
jgi:exopolysaccharide biosynthesis polyprenyl glycosylphosphotransferase